MIDRTSIIRCDNIAIPLAAIVFAFVVGCSDHGFCPCDPDPPTLVPQIIPAPTSPENVVEAIEVLYNDKVRTARDRSQAYARLFDSAFVFHFQAADVAQGLPESWGLDQELAANSAIFNASESGHIYSLEIRIVHGSAVKLIPHEPGNESWKKVFATDVYLRLMVNIEDGLEVSGGQADFIFPPAQQGEWKMIAWADLPSRPADNEAGGRKGEGVEPSTWGRIKYGYAAP